MQELFVDTPEQLLDLCARLRGSRWLALDTEFMREQTYYPQFCLLQIGNGDIAAAVDPIALPELGPLVELLCDPRIMKVFHAGRQDLEIFHHLWGRLPEPLFDTQPAAALLGHGDQIGYGNLVQEVLGLQLTKGHARTDWARRPLDPEQLRYALDDVIYLGQLYPRMEAELQRLGRLDWLKGEFAILADPATYTPEDCDLWQRVKGRQPLRGVQLAVLQALAHWREDQARTSDRPRRWILKDEVMIDLARRMPKEPGQLERVRGLEGGTVKRHGQRLLQLIGEARALPKEQWPMEGWIPPRLTPNQEAQVDLLACALRLIANHHQISPAALGGRKELERLVSGERDGELMSGWKGALLREPLLRVLEGTLVPRVSDGELVLGEA